MCAKRHVLCATQRTVLSVSADTYKIMMLRAAQSGGGVDNEAALKNEELIVGQWWHMPLISALRRQSQADL